ncbi:hypothetical protein J2T55_000804 [Methylohalomonas lacus]|uniref:Uncharacterized protein n=1 Tax=Methylohalomonas lacus TaxID=398773 RepID=A0AAE3L0Y1_9GAMM|nr:hypothetical protein [Methylohalomonas lacus]MCS3902800.1 hypothetical protein [Methylohalomonas lacus]
MGKYDHLSLDELIKKARAVIPINHVERLIKLSQERRVNFIEKQGLQCAACQQEKEPDGLVYFFFDISDQINQDANRQYPIGFKSPPKGWHFTFWVCEKCRVQHVRNPFEVRLACMDFYCLKLTGRGIFDSDNQVMM